MRMYRCGLEVGTTTSVTQERVVWLDFLLKMDWFVNHMGGMAALPALIGGVALYGYEIACQTGVKVITRFQKEELP
jgi:hypothetical protein